MRSYLDIIIDLKEGRKPEYEEIRLACLMANSLLFFAEQDLKKILDTNQSSIIKKLTQKSIEHRFYAKKKSPEEYLGDHHPDNPQQKEFMKFSKKIFDKVMKDNGMK